MTIWSASFEKSDITGNFPLGVDVGALSAWIASLKGHPRGRHPYRRPLGWPSVISNAARYLTGAAKDSAIGFNTSNIQNTYSQDSSVTLSGNSFYVRDEQDIRSLAIEIAVLTKRQQRGKGLRMA